MQLKRRKKTHSCAAKGEMKVVRQTSYRRHNNKCVLLSKSAS